MNVAVAKIGEEWRTVPDTPYEISSLGRVRRGGRILKPRQHTNGYHRVIFSIGGKHTDHYVHRLVCAAFHGTPPSADCHADHIDNCRTNNIADNLRWLPPGENRARRNFACGERNGVAKYSEELIREVLQRARSGESAVSIASDLPMSSRYVRSIKNGKVWGHINA